MKTVYMLAWGVLFALIASPAMPQEIERNKIEVVGKARAVLEPDYIEWVVDIYTSDVAPKVALAVNDSMREKLLSVIDKADVDDADVVVGRPNIKRVVSESSSKWRPEEEYLSTDVHVRVTFYYRKLEKIEPLLTQLHELCLDYRMTYKSSAYDKTYQRVQREALEKARQAATEQAGVLGQKIGPALSIEVSDECHPLYAGVGLFGDDSDDDHEVGHDAAGVDGKVHVSAYAYVMFALE